MAKEARKLSCPYCKIEFVSTNKQQIFCSYKCATAKGHKDYRDRKKAENKSQEFFNFDDYKEGIIV